MTRTQIAILASGTGSNALNLIRYFSHHRHLEVAFVLSNKEDAPVLAAAEELGVPVYHQSNAQVSDGELLKRFCADRDVNWIVLAGYLRKIPVELIRAYPEKIINLHPSILPNYGGKGMYGANVHKAVLAAKETQSGISIHFVNEEFDKGRMIAQFYCPLDEKDDVSSLSAKISYLEQSYLPKVVESTILT
ncbi:MAG: phosphoribosylglycinamide formyltransferase-1 [Crocinitomicaceae bacterium]|jgi:phosphoribosylglycinamide formyltransferase-1